MWVCHLAAFDRCKVSLRRFNFFSILSSFYKDVFNSIESTEYLNDVDVCMRKFDCTGQWSTTIRTVPTDTRTVPHSESSVPTGESTVPTECLAGLHSQREEGWGHRHQDSWPIQSKNWMDQCQYRHCPWYFLGMPMLLFTTLFLRCSKAEEQHPTFSSA